MFLRLLFESFRRQKRRKSVALLAIAMGMSIATAMIAVGTDIGDKMSQELRSLGANLVITPIEDTLDVNLGDVDLKPASEGAFIPESSLARIKGIFWGHNIKGYAPFLFNQESFAGKGGTFSADLIGTYFAQPLKYGKEEFTTGVRSVNPWWTVEGAWPPDYPAWPEVRMAVEQRCTDGLPCRKEFVPRSDDTADVLAGKSLAASSGLRVGDVITVRGRQLRISGILNSGGSEDRAEVVRAGESVRLELRKAAVAPGSGDLVAGGLPAFRQGATDGRGGHCGFGPSSRGRTCGPST